MSYLDYMWAVRLKSGDLVTYAGTRVANRSAIRLYNTRGKAAGMAKRCGGTVVTLLIHEVANNDA